MLVNIADESQGIKKYVWPELNCARSPRKEKACPTVATEENYKWEVQTVV